MANRKTERIDMDMDKEVRDQIMQLLRERVENPTLPLDTFVSNPPHIPRTVAAAQLRDAKYVNGVGLITLAGMDYYRRETMRCRWVRETGFRYSLPC